MLKIYWELTKPGIIFGNVITTAAGFALASRGSIDWILFLATLVGMSLVVASGCVCNNYIDRSADTKMARTKNRAIPTGQVSRNQALIFAFILGVSGLLLLDLTSNHLTTFIAFIGFATYVFLYTLLKYKTTHGTLIGSVAGAIPPVIGYCAVSNRLDLGAALLFFIVVCWQMPHFFAIVMFRFNDYLAAGIPALPIKKGSLAAKKQMLFYISSFLAVSLMPTLFGFTGYLYFATALILGTVWLVMCIQGFKVSSDKIWARKMFIFSLVVIMGLCAMMAADVTSSSANCSV